MAVIHSRQARLDFFGAVDSGADSVTLKQIMKTLLIILFSALIISGTSGIVSGFIDHGSHQGIGCFASALRGGECSSSSEPWDLLSFHLGALRTYSGTASEITLLSVIFTALVLPFIVYPSQKLLGQFAEKHRIFRRVPLRRKKTFSWLALHEMRDSDQTA